MRQYVKKTLHSVTTTYNAFTRIAITLLERSYGLPCSRITDIQDCLL